MTPPFKLRVAENADRETLLPLVGAYHAFEGIEMSDQARVAAITPLLGDNTFGRIWLISKSDRIVGYIALCFGYSIEFGGRDAFVDEFFIDETARGQGIGKEVLEAVKIEAQKLGVVALHLEVACTNTRAKKLYSSCGFDARENFNLMSCTLTNLQ